MLSGMNPQTENEILDSFEQARNHPDIWITFQQSQLSILQRRWLDLPAQDGRAEMLFQMVKDSLDMAYKCMFLLKEERRGSSKGSDTR